MGYIQEQIINIGKEKGFVTTSDVAKFYQQSKIIVEMNKLIALGYFEKAEDCTTFIMWKFKKVQDESRVE